MSAVTTLTCPCGLTLKAPGARPGRVGKCPRCGGLLRVPEERPAEVPKAARREPEGDEGPPPAGYGLDAAPTTSAFVPPPVRARPKTVRGHAEEGPIAPPKDGDDTLGKSLAYPLWSWSSLSLLLYLPPALTLVSIPVLPLLDGAFFGGTGFTIGPFLLLVPGCLMGVCVWGYTLVYLGNVLISSATGELLPPRTPRFGEEDVLRVLGRWFWGAIVGVGVGAVPAVAYWIYCGEIDWADQLIFINLMGLGAAYAQMALLAVLLYDDPLAANPITVIRAIRRVGWDYAGVCFLSGAYLVSLIFQLSALAVVRDPGWHLVGLWAFWVDFLYGAMVVLRRLGIFCHRHRVLLAWFPDRPRWGR